ncbi:MAG: hypothetical protein V3T65_05870, partial [Acidobacteriota bacterium]
MAGKARGKRDLCRHQAQTKETKAAPDPPQEPPPRPLTASPSPAGRAADRQVHGVVMRLSLTSTFLFNLYNHYIVTSKVCA